MAGDGRRGQTEEELGADAVPPRDREVIERSRVEGGLVAGQTAKGSTVDLLPRSRLGT